MHYGDVNKTNSHSLMQMVGDVETVRHQYIQRDIGKSSKQNPN